ncbi:hypothetical protein [Cystobacter fuscus]|uniref:hypothetical protein n=1 Tax=Cystobacter fuscus TaxID=43 RepID=UPI0012FD41E7|nr:hypothetical protein [Cystobacter fuscus]
MSSFFQRTRRRSWEREYKQGPENLERLLELRQQKSHPLIERLQQWACEQRALP